MEVIVPRTHMYRSDVLATSRLDKKSINVCEQLSVTFKESFFKKMQEKSSSKPHTPLCTRACNYAKRTSSTQYYSHTSAI